MFSPMGPLASRGGVWQELSQFAQYPPAVCSILCIGTGTVPIEPPSTCAGNDFHAASNHQRWTVVASGESAQRQTAFEEVIGAFGPFGTDGSWITTRLSLPRSAVDDMAVDPNRLTG